MAAPGSNRGRGLRHGDRLWMVWTGARTVSAANQETSASPAQVGVDARIVGASGVIALDRPRALNALSIAMKSAMSQAYPRFARDPQVYVAVIRSTSPRAFCAGGDVREIISLAAADPAAARRAMKDEYSLCWLHECFSKPSVALIDGVVMGGGVGISLYATHRVAGAGYRFAMPETAIGFFPDDGVAHALARLPDHVGMYLGLTGRDLGRADALALGLATHAIEADHFPAIEAGLADAEVVDGILARFHRDPGPSPLAALRPAIARCFSAPTLAEVLERLDAEAKSGDAAGWAKGVLDDLARRSPLALAVTFRHIREASALDLRLTLMRDYRLARAFLETPDFAEGVRAILIDKSGSPRWQPAHLDDVTPAMVERAFARDPADDLVLPTRKEMQAARV